MAHLLMHAGYCQTYCMQISSSRVKLVRSRLYFVVTKTCSMIWNSLDTYLLFSSFWCAVSLCWLHVRGTQECSGGVLRGGGRVLSPLKILIQKEIICDSMPNFSQFVKNWHYFTFEIQLFQFISVPFLEVRPVLVIFPIFRMVFWLIRPVVIVTNFTTWPV